MRPLRLTIEAFGSFAGREEVDFESLGDLGLFLVTGPTGSGKTTIFDAMVFALYGTVPGSRRAEEVHSQHAPLGSVPRVTLEFEAGGGRYRVERTARYDRPVRRGEGVTTEQPTAALATWRADGWQPLLAGVRDVTDAIVDRVGLSAEQFLRVVLLPQGQFEQFLVSRSDERKVLLRQLFGTEVYERAVEHLREASAQARQAAHLASSGVGHHRDVLTRSLGDAEELTGTARFDDAPVPERIERLRASLDAAVEHARRSEAISVEAERALAEAEALGQRWAAREVRLARLAELRADAGSVTAERAAAAAAARARGVRDQLEPRTRRADHLAVASAACDAAAATLHRQAAELAWCLDDRPDVHEVRRSLAVAERDARRAVEAHLAVETATAAVAAAEQALVAADQTVADLARRIAGDEARHGVLVGDLERESAVASRLDAARTAAADADDRLDRRRRLDAMRAELAAAAAAADRAEHDHRSAFGRFLDDVAPRLAAQLADGEPCAVCGSVEHPQPAVRADDLDPVSIEELDELREQALDAGRRRDELAGAVVGMRAELGESADLPLDTLAAEATAAAGAVAAAVEAAGRVRRITEAVTALAEALAAARAERAAADVRRDAAVAQLARQREAAATATEAVRQLGASGGPDLGTVVGAQRRLAGLATLTSALDTYDQARRGLDAAQAADDAAAAALDAALVAGGWDDVADAACHVLPDAQIAAIERRVAAWDAECHALAAQVAVDEAELVDAPPDVAAVRAFAAAAAGERRAASDRSAALAVHVAQAERAAAEIGPLELAMAEALRRAELAATVHERCAGQLAPKVSLESWVLGTELDRVVDAANVHLVDMTAGRFRLVRVTDTTDARVSTGLDLVVDDAYTGSSRRTTSLSGGERFQASLALALGLADVVTSGVTATARTLDALFVDEGFGSLDAASLDQAIATLDRLRGHGRQIGVITHVETMQAALPIGIVVERLPGDAGARIRQPLHSR